MYAFYINAYLHGDNLIFIIFIQFLHLRFEKLKKKKILAKTI